MNTWTFLFIYLAGAALVALRIGWHIRYRLDKYDRRFCDLRFAHWNYSLFWPLVLVFSPKSLFSPTFATSRWSEGRAETERELDRLAVNLPPCSASIRYAPKRDEAGECESEFVFDTATVVAIMEKRLVELPADQHGRYPAILSWLRQRNSSSPEPADVPAAWHGLFLNVAVGMMNRGLGQVKCGKCGEVIPQEEISLHSSPENIKTSSWSYTIWRCPREHKLLTKDAIHFHIRSN
jgi:hypothetical protein